MIVLAKTTTLCLIPTYPIVKTHSVSRRRSTSVSTSITHQHKRSCECYDLHDKLVPYSDAWNWQKEIVADKKLVIENVDCPDTLIVLQHHPVYTMGTGSSLEYLNFDVDEAPFQVYRTERGGEVTYHGPGQLVMYPILNLRNHEMDLHWYLRALEEVIIRALDSTFSIKASRVEGLTGVWVGDHKLAAIGIKVSQWITYHGLALNVTTDLRPFDWIVPCGIKNRKVGSIKKLLLGETRFPGGVDDADFPSFDDAQLIDITCKSLIKEFSEVFQLALYQKPVENMEHFGEETRKSLSDKQDTLL